MTQIQNETMGEAFSLQNLLKLFKHRPVQVLTAGWLMVNLALIILGPEMLPVSLISGNGMAHVFLFLGTNVTYLIHLGVIYAVTLRREKPDILARTPERPIAIRETVWLWVYGLVALIFLGGWFDIGLHLPGTIFDPSYELTSNSVLIWAAVNFVLFAVIPYVVFKRLGYTNDDMGLRSHNFRGDVVLIIVVLVLESLIEFFGIPDGMRFFNLTPTQMSLGGLLTLIIHLFGTGLPIMIFIQAILVPRYYRISGSLTASVIAGGLSYATFHIFEFWTLYESA
ncbi:MAG: hypothetical protein AAGD96_15810, partial [Chloroflexota bacterium]